AWQWNAQQICGDCRIQLPKSSFHGSIGVRNVGGLRLTRFSSSPVFFWKWPADSVNLGNRFCIVITQIAGVRRYLQNGSSILLRSGDSTVIDSGLPWSSTCSTDCVRLYLRVPRWMMEDRLRMREIPIAQRIGGDARMGATLFGLSQSLYEEAELMKEEEGTAALDSYFEVLGACIGSPEIPSAHGHELGVRILRFIDAHIAQPTLRPVEIASAVGISVRHLHRLFAANGGSTLGDYIRGRRLERCRDDLANPRLRGRNITEIAFFWGFSDSAHFSHSFRRRFGMSPRTFRAQTSILAQSNVKDERLCDVSSAEMSESRSSRPN
ncbi:MAG TPA: helix-turn-helix domain-containing protein, partial [Terriglobales bacterium]|nr:helix-turn-helix domain-containing protein [Terriglobales bacterium]